MLNFSCDPLNDWIRIAGIRVSLKRGCKKKFIQRPDTLQFGILYTFWSFFFFYRLCHEQGVILRSWSLLKFKKNSRSDLMSSVRLLQNGNGFSSFFYKILLENFFWIIINVSFLEIEKKPRFQKQRFMGFSKSLWNLINGSFLHFDKSENCLPVGIGQTDKDRVQKLEPLLLLIWGMGHKFLELIQCPPVDQCNT